MCTPQPSLKDSCRFPALEPVHLQPVPHMPSSGPSHMSHNFSRTCDQGPLTVSQLSPCRVETERTEPGPSDIPPLSPMRPSRKRSVSPLRDPELTTREEDLGSKATGHERTKRAKTIQSGNTRNVLGCSSKRSVKVPPSRQTSVLGRWAILSKRSQGTSPPSNQSGEPGSYMLERPGDGGQRDLSETSHHRSGSSYDSVCVLFIHAYGCTTCTDSVVFLFLDRLTGTFKSHETD